jgi:hypothetical protein
VRYGTRDAIVRDIVQRWTSATGPVVDSAARAPTPSDEVVIDHGTIHLNRPSDRTLLGSAGLALVEGRWRVAAAPCLQHHARPSSGKGRLFDRMDDALSWIAKTPLEDFSGDPDLVFAESKTWRRIDRLGPLDILIAVDPEAPHRLTSASTIVKVDVVGAAPSLRATITLDEVGYTSLVWDDDMNSSTDATPAAAARFVAEHLRAANPHDNLPSADDIVKTLLERLRRRDAAIRGEA